MVFVYKKLAQFAVRCALPPRRAESPVCATDNKPSCVLHLLGWFIGSRSFSSLEGRPEFWVLHSTLCMENHSPHTAQSRNATHSGPSSGTYPTWNETIIPPLVSRQHVIHARPALQAPVHTSPLHSTLLLGTSHFSLNMEAFLPVCIQVTSVVSNSLQPYGLQPTKLFSVHGILQARILEWVAMPSSRGSSSARDGSRISYVSCIGRQVLYHQHHLRSLDVFLLFSIPGNSKLFFP